ncbi:cysteine dioxygenase [Novosphingobium sp. PS1R-30]|uniref:Cysteine dioxygenase n=1 Tax=Novosphingobium anseongense TaxID=3133436 RepID=A0ABU8S1N8_9SPHN
MAATPKFEKFTEQFSQLVEQPWIDEHGILNQGSALLRDLVSTDDWLPEELSRPHPQYYQQYLLHCDPEDRYCVVSFVWGPGQRTPIHDHGIWALIGMLRGAERSEEFSLGGEGQALCRTGEKVLQPGDVEQISLRTGDIHRVSNMFEDRISISIHVYGGDIGRLKRRVFDETTGETRDFVSGYSNAQPAT